MGTKVLASSVAVLDEADRQQRIIDWMLFANEQDSRLFGHNEEIKWVPGQPMYAKPVRSRYGYFGGNYIRPMIEEIDDDDDISVQMDADLIECRSCEVLWGYSEGPDCWVCGVAPDNAEQLIKWMGYSSDRDDIIAYAENDAELTMRAFRNMSQVNVHVLAPSFRAAGEAVADFGRTVERHMSFWEPITFSWTPILDEWQQHWLNINPGPIEPYIYQPPRNEQVFIRGERPSLRVVDWVAADVNAPIEINGRHYLGPLPSGWRQMRSEIPVPVVDCRLSGTDLEQFGDRRYLGSGPDWSRRRRGRG